MDGDRNHLWKKSLAYIQRNTGISSSDEGIDFSNFLLKVFARETDEEINRKLLKELIEKYSKVVKELEEKIEIIEKMSMTDGLTGLYNRKKFSEEFKREVKRCRRTNGSLTLAVLDIDHFKKVNDTYGHETGDQVLIEFCSVVKKNIREVDVFARWGGEEFTLILVETSKENSSTVLERIRKEIEDFNFTHAGRVTCSIGSVSIEDGPSDEMFSKADEALCRAKRKGRNRVTYSA